MNLAIYHEKYVFAASFGDVPSHVESDPLYISLEKSFHLDQLGIHIIRSRLRQGWKSVRRHSLPCRNLDIYTLLQGILSQVLPPFPDKNCAVHRIGERVHAQGSVSTIHNRPDVCLSQVLEGIEAAKAAGLEPVKLNMVVMAGINDDELLDFAAKTITEEWHVRFIELMPLNGEDAPAPRFISAGEMRKQLEKLGKLEPCLPGIGNGPAKYFRFPNAKGSIGFITPVSEHFCFNCNRLRLTADGKLRPCLLSDYEIDLKAPLRAGTSLAGLKKLIEEAAANKPLRHHMAEGHVPKERPFSQVGG